MRKNFLLWMFTILMLVIGMSSCSSDDDDYNYVQEFGDNNNVTMVSGYNETITICSGTSMTL